MTKKVAISSKDRDFLPQGAEVGLELESWQIVEESIPWLEHATHEGFSAT